MIRSYMKGDVDNALATLKQCVEGKTQDLRIERSNYDFDLYIANITTGEELLIAAVGVGCLLPKEIRIRIEEKGWT